MKNNSYLLFAGILLTGAVLFFCLPSTGEPQKKTADSTTRSAQAGKDLYMRLHCASCHSIDGVGGCIAPPLVNVTKRRSPEYINMRLGAAKEDKFVQLIKHPELFPHPRFQDSQVRDLLSYLKTLERTPTASQNVVKHKLPAALAQEKPEQRQWRPLPQGPSTREGRRLFLELGCLSCHSAGHTGGAIGPSLDGIGGKHSAGYIAAHITDPYAHLKATRKGAKSGMVQPDLLPDQVKALTDYLRTLPDLKK